MSGALTGRRRRSIPYKKDSAVSTEDTGRHPSPPWTCLVLLIIFW